MSLQQYHVPFTSQSEVALRAGHGQLIALMHAGDHAQMALAVDRIDSLGEVVRAVFGEEVVRDLERQNRHDRRGRSLLLLTEKIRARRLDGPVIAAFASPAMLTHVLQCPGVTAMVFVAATEAGGVPRGLSRLAGGRRAFRRGSAVRVREPAASRVNGGRSASMPSHPPGPR